MKKFKAGQRVRAPFPNTHEVKHGVVEEAFDVLYFVRFDDDTTAIYSHRDVDVIKIKELENDT